MKNALPIQTPSWFKWLHKKHSRSSLNKGFTVLIRSTFMDYEEQSTTLCYLGCSCPAPFSHAQWHGLCHTYSQSPDSSVETQLLNPAENEPTKEQSKRIKITNIRTGVKRCKRDGEQDPLTEAELVQDLVALTDLKLEHKADAQYLENVQPRKHLFRFFLPN